MESTFSKLGAVLGLLKLLLGLAELGKIQCSNLLGFFNLLLVGLDLLLKLGGELRHTVLVLLVLIILELKLLDLTFSLLVSFHIFSSVSLNISKFNFQLSNTGLELCHSVLTATHGAFI